MRYSDFFSLDVKNLGLQLNPQQPPNCETQPGPKEVLRKASPRVTIFQSNRREKIFLLGKTSGYTL